MGLGGGLGSRLGGEIEGDSIEDFRGDFKQDMKFRLVPGQVLSRSGKGSLEFDSEVGQLV